MLTPTSSTFDPMIFGLSGAASVLKVRESKQTEDSKPSEERPSENCCMKAEKRRGATFSKITLIMLSETHQL